MSKKNKQAIIDENLLNKAASKGLSEVYRIKNIKIKKDKIRAQYGNEFLRKYVFGLLDAESEEVQAFEKELQDIDAAHKYKDTISGELTEA